MKQKLISILTLFFLSCSIISKKHEGKNNLSKKKKKSKKYVPKFGPSNKNKDTFVDVTKEYNLENLTSISTNVIDLNYDGYSDLILVPAYYSTPRAFLFDPNKNKFYESKEEIFDDKLKSSYLLFYDFNNDGVIDLLSIMANQKTELAKIAPLIYLGKKDKNSIKFLHQSSILNSSPTSTISAVVLDYDADGKLDLFLGNWFEQNALNTLAVPDKLLRNTGTSFEDKSSILYEETQKDLSTQVFKNARPTFGLSICDIDFDGKTDVLTASTNLYPNKLWLNLIDKLEFQYSFVDFGKKSLYSDDFKGRHDQRGGGRSFLGLCSDYNNDLIFDVFLAELNHNYDDDKIDRSSILTGSTYAFPPKFIRTEYLGDASEVNWNQGDRRAIWADFNNDGLLDLLVDNSGFPPHSKLILFFQNPDHSFDDMSSNMSIDITNPTNSVLLDFNKDGKMDLLTFQSDIRDKRIKQRLYLFKNDQILLGKKSMRIYLDGKKSNQKGIGAIIKIKIKNKDLITSRMQFVQYSYGAFTPQNEEGIHFGLSEGEELLEIQVIWPFRYNKKSEKINLISNVLIKEKFNKHIEFTICENNTYLIGKKSCN